ncbi:MAG TPA: hypothetical protein GXX20_01070 [Clostridiaceae bacterium]|nr:hypothetical protein [Clostridiaceae bacterium]
MYNKGLDLNYYNADEIRLAEWALENVEVFKDSIPVPISWDSTPGNWLVDEDENFTGMIDFENMLWGIDVDNFAILFERYFPDCPNGKDAFFRGYGADVLENKELMIKIVCIKKGLSDILWGLENNEDRNVKLGRNMLLSISHTITNGLP